MLKTVMLLNIVVQNVQKTVRILWWIESSKEQYLLWNSKLCDLLNVFTVTFDQFKASFAE